MLLMRTVYRLLLLLLCLLSSPLNAAPWIASVEQRNGLSAVSIGGASAVSADFVFWKKDWAFFQPVDRAQGVRAFPLWDCRKEPGNSAPASARRHIGVPAPNQTFHFISSEVWR
jgi:hypothetical protein